MIFNIPNPFRGKDKPLKDLPGHHNPCRVCWRFTCNKCLVFLLCDFAAVLRSNPKLSGEFEKQYNRTHDRRQKVVPIGYKGKNKFSNKKVE